MNQVKEIQERLKNLGFDQKRLDETMGLIYQDIQEELAFDFTNIATEEDVSEYESRIKDSKSLEHFTNIVQELATKVYGEGAQEKIMSMLTEKLLKVEELTNNMKSNLEKYQAGNPDTIKAVSDAMDSQDAKDIAQQMIG